MLSQVDLRNAVITEFRRLSHDRPMDTKRGPGKRAIAFKAWMDAHGTNTRQVSTKANVPYTTLASFVQGGTQSLKGGTEELIAAALGVPIAQLFQGEQAGDRIRRTVPVVGYVGAGAAAHFYGSGDGELDRVEAPDYANENTVAAEIRGESMGPLLEHWLVFWDEIRTPVTPDLLGHICVVGLPDDRILVKQLKAASAPGLFHLISNNEAPMLDQEIMWAAKVKGMQPR